MRYRLRTLLAVLALGPPMLAGGWYVADDLRERFTRQESVKLPPPPRIPAGIPGGTRGPHVIPPDAKAYPVPGSEVPSDRDSMADLDLNFKHELFSSDRPFQR